MIWRPWLLNMLWQPAVSHDCVDVKFQILILNKLVAMFVFMFLANLLKKEKLVIENCCRFINLRKFFSV